MRHPCRLLLTLALVTPAPVLAQERLRLIVETDLGGDPDDQASLVRFLLHLPSWDLEGIVYDRYETDNDGAAHGDELMGRFLDAYAAAYDNLRKHDPRFPTPARLRAVTHRGFDPSRKVDNAEGRDGVERILAALDAEDPRPLWYNNWGSDTGVVSSMERALDEIQATRSPAEYERAIARLRISRNSDKIGAHIHRVVLNVNQRDPERFYREWRGLTATAGFDARRDVKDHHGPLGALYTTVKEGDTPGFLYLFPTGMNDPEQPGWGSWAGRFGPRDQDLVGPAFWWANAEDTLRGTTSRGNTVARWADAIQDEFRARMDWAVAGRYADGNHPPRAVVEGDTAPDRILQRDVAAGSAVPLSAAGSSDPDGDGLHYRWEVYLEAGSYAGSVEIEGADQPHCTVRVPADAAGRTIHIVLSVRDDDRHRAALLGKVAWYTDPTPMTRYRRVVLRVGAP